MKRQLTCLVASSALVLAALDTLAQTTTTKPATPTISGFSSSPVSGFTGNPVSGFSTSPVSGFSPAPVTGLTPNSFGPLRTNVTTGFGSVSPLSTTIAGAGTNNTIVSPIIPQPPPVPNAATVTSGTNNGTPLF